MLLVSLWDLQRVFMLALILLNTSNFCICSIKNVEKIPVTMTATTNMTTVKEIGGRSVVNSGGCEAMKYTENVIGDFLSFEFFLLLFLLFFGCVSLRSSLNYCLHFPHDFLWWLKVLVGFICIHKLSTEREEIRTN